MEPNRSALVVGGGPAGLLAADHLARAGLTVTVLEARAQLGGRSSSTSHGGIAMNQGPHALYVGGAAKRELAAVGIDPPSWMPRLTGAVWLRDGAARRAPGGPRALTGLRRWAAGLRRSDPDLAGMSAAEWLRREVPDPDARRIAGAFARVTTYTADQDALSADVAAQQVRLAAWPGVRYLGAWGSLIERMAASARAAGVQIETGAAVRAVTREDGWRVTTDAGDRCADLVVLASGGPDRAAKLLGREVPAPGPAAEVGALDLVLHRLPRPSRTFAAGIDSPHYFSIHTRPGQTPVHVSVAAYLAAEDRTSGTPEALEAIVDAVQPGWRAELIAEPRHLARVKALTAIPTAAAGGLAGRPGPTLPGASGLALAGDWVGGEGLLLDGALASARAAASALLAPEATAVPSAAAA